MTDQKYKISVLLPTRGRMDMLKKSVASLVDRAEDLSGIKIMLGFDEDDTKGIEYFQESLQPWLDDKNVNYSALLFEPLGYGRLNEYVNSLAKQSDADWYFFWNDDAVMETDAWDQAITSHTGEFKLLAVHTHNDHPYSIFPIVPREWMDTLGYLSPHPLTDAWLSQQAYILDIWERIDVHVTHDRFDLTGNNKDTTYESRNVNQLEGNPSNPKDFHNIYWINYRISEAARLADYMESRGLDLTWWKNVKDGKQDPWEKVRTNDVNNQMAHFRVPI